MISGSRKSKSRLEKLKGRISTRRPNPRPLRKRVLIVCEGDTERNYFCGLREEKTVDQCFVLKILRGTGGAPDGIVANAIRLRDEQSIRDRGGSKVYTYDSVWCVLDVESPENPEPVRKAKALAENNGIEVCFSNPSFEIWLLGHFVREGKSYNCAKSVEDRLDKFWQGRTGRDYDKCDRGIYNIISGLTDQAIQNAQWVREEHHKNKKNPLDCNSSTEVYRLVKFLLSRD